MALINCPECGKRVSDKAGNCPNCGCPIQPEQETKTEDVANMNGDISEEDYKDLCEHLDYEDILREPDAYDGKYCIVDGTVDQIIEGWFGSFTIFVVDEDGNKWGCTYSYDEGESRVLEGDNVTMYGKCQGTSNTETVLGEQVTLPHVDAKYID